MTVGVVHPNRNGLWDHVLVDTLLACGVRRVVLCPGGRNGLLAITLHRSAAIASILHVDERSAGFLAIGAMLADGAPTAVCTTSGSAVANLLPAMAEAEARDLPLVLLTCDRPLTGRLRGEPQTLPQTALCAPLARTQLGLPDPLDGTMTLAELRDCLTDTLRSGLAGDRPGPVHINIPQWGAYCATEDDLPGEVVLPTPPGHLIPWDRLAGPEEVHRVMERVGVGPGARGLILAGPDQPLPIAAVTTLLNATAYPLIADIGSGLRHFDLPGMVTSADALAEAGALDVSGLDVLIRLGGAPVSPGLLRTMKRVRCPVINIFRHRSGPDFLSPHAIGLNPPAPKALEALQSALGPGDAHWAQEWQTTEMLAATARDVVLAAAEWGEMAAVGRLCAATGFAALHCANSLSVRHAGLLMPAGYGPARVFSARGVNGTDGTLGMVLGEALAGDGRMLALIGDQAFVHDLPALANPLWRTVKGALCVMNNAGGGLFDLTPARRIDNYAATMRNAPAIDFAGIAKAFSLIHLPCGSCADVDAALAEAAQADILCLVEIRVPSGTVARDLPQLVRTCAFAASSARRPQSGAAAA